MYIYVYMCRTSQYECIIIYIFTIYIMYTHINTQRITYSIKSCGVTQHCKSTILQLKNH